MKTKLLFLPLFGLVLLPCAWAQAQQSPIPENPGVQPQIDITGTGTATLDIGGNRNFGSAGFATNGQVNLSDSAFAIGFSQRLYRRGIGNLTAGVQSYDFSNLGTQSGLFLNQLFLDFQDERFETYLGRTDSPTAQIVQFPTLRGDDLVDFTTVPNPFSDGQNVEEHRYANVAAVVLNQGLTHFANFHVQHLIDSTNAGTGTDLNSYGASYQYQSTPTLEPITKVVSYGVGFEHRAIPSNLGGASDAVYGGGTINLKPGVTSRIDLRIFDAYTTGNNTQILNTFNDTYRANANATSVSLRYLNSPFGKPAYTLALTAGYKTFRDLANSNESALVLTGAKRLGDGFDAVAQLGYFHRSGQLAAINGHADSTVLQLGFSFSFNATINEHIGPRRSPMNILHHYLPN